MSGPSTTTGRTASDPGDATPFTLRTLPPLVAVLSTLAGMLFGLATVVVMWLIVRVIH